MFNKTTAKLNANSPSLLNLAMHFIIYANIFVLFCCYLFEGGLNAILLLIFSPCRMAVLVMANLLFF